ncbi:MAG: SMC-Scp complex subunit ScpB [Candidatus Magasanikbacteria bacterium RIFCSPLOWO2_02_FULL_44_11]|uniref:SMC-Scp complex subunit ScpB n=2 Tax=Candidatus Magasanikiibacteriota TaxID=1752731 RepID=A0A1F6NAZ4_9BACT|nr:MAG: SMC-Scp complex subunit ScpB [Candidatus Magasanikbacteria bacterium RIFCSPHIGHO2_02_FULL_45_10]OGH80968.1 MAG: SMC-Scp complex subunit ScpB [Candidatus Magasanikbacteria bacterium RIFCSPLOWO2_02_FULL_44_11]
MPLAQQLEAMLFVASKPLAVKRMAKIVEAKENDVTEALEKLVQKYDRSSGVVLLRNNDEWQLVANAEMKVITEKFVKAEVSGELTRPQLETLTVISYCGPITKPELEQLRGVNCGLILRNLLIRGLVREADGDGLLPVYEVTMDYIRHLGLTSLDELPEYAELHNHSFVTQALEVRE